MREPQFQLPMCYYLHPPALKTGHLSKFQLETLFHIFYALPKDVLQAYSAQELYSRQWRYHAELKLWFKKWEETDNVRPLGRGEGPANPDNSQVSEQKRGGGLRKTRMRASERSKLVTTSVRCCSEPLLISSFCSVQFIFFDINSWERRAFNGNMQANVVAGLLSVEEVRVQFAS